ncbi:SDR family NAD(P)-dependent oxidoreductase [Bryobacter aggregatus]|uniref:SDR family NAD(P)-dependent oxidoreductase n=1 Tax=Bryobacter aggregatus TaxID=360054 RepID=UPI0004E0BCDB|nr:SDR family oxidoreductase [Bryobacter aggregatus]
MAFTSLEGKTVLVTGAAKRIGRSIAMRLYREKARVLIHYGNSRQDAEEVSALCGHAPIFQADLSKVSEIERLFQEVGPLDCLVNNAARFTKIDPLLVTEADWDFIHSTNLKAYFFCAQHAARQMLQSEHGGRIVNISSIGGIQAWPMYVHYCASKAGVIHMTKAMARAWAPKISVNSVAPGAIPFEEADSAPLQALKERTPAGRFGTGDEIADAVVYFLTATQFVTGQLTVVDGGLTLT